MALILHLAASEEAETQRAPLATIDGEGRLTIGRAGDNDVVLDDPNRKVSKHHCAIESAAGRYLLRDLSRNGTYLNDALQPIPQDRPIPLEQGDRIRVGNFHLVLSMDVPDEPAPLEPPAAVVQSEPPAERSFLGVVGDLPERSLYAIATPASQPFLEGDEPFGPLGAEESIWPGAGPSHGDHVEMIESAYVPPGSMLEPIPEDWDLVAELGGSARRATPIQDEEALSQSSSPIEPPAEPPVQAPEPVPEPVLNAPDSSGASQAAILAFLAASGLGSVERGQVDEVEMMARAGRMLRLTVTHLHAMLDVRSSTKRDFGVERTMIGRNGNNPLKFIAEPTDAMRALLIHTLPGFLVAEEAIEGAFNAIEEHQAAIPRAMQAALEKVCARLAPATIETSLGPPSPVQRLAGTLRAAACWRAYRAAFDDVTAGIDNDSARVFGDEMAFGYRAAGNVRPAAGGRHGR